MAEELRAPAQTAGGHAGSLGQICQNLAISRNHNIAGIPAFRNRGDGQTFGEFGGEILQAVDRKICFAAEEAGVEFLGEKPLVADFREWDIEDFIPRGFDRNRLESRFGKAFFQLAPDPICLPEGQLASARGDSEFLFQAAM